VPPHDALDTGTGPSHNARDTVLPRMSWPPHDALDTGTGPRHSVLLQRVGCCHCARDTGPRDNLLVAAGSPPARGGAWVVLTVVFGVLVLSLVACAGPSAPATPAPTVAPALTTAPAPTAATPAVRPTFAPAAPGVVPPALNPTALAGAQAQPTVDSTSDDDADIVDAFLGNIDDVVSEAYDLSLTPCDDMMRVLQANPNLVPSIHGFAANLKRVGSSQPVLDRPDVKDALADLDTNIAQMDGALSACGISQT
jgi:hypothetical protein